MPGLLILWFYEFYQLKYFYLISIKGPHLNRMNTTCREHSNIVFETVEKTAQSSHFHSMQQKITSDASRVKVKGPGLQKAFRNQKANFVVDTREAGKS